MLKIACIIAVYIALRYGSLGYEFDMYAPMHAPIEKIANLMKIPGVLTCGIHRFDVKIDETMANYAKGLIRSGNSAALKGISSRDVDLVFSLLDKQKRETISIFAIEFMARGPDLFTHNNSRWKWEENGKEHSVSFDFCREDLGHSSRPLLVSEKDGFSFEFNLGPPFSEAENIGRSFIKKYHLQDDIEYALSEPAVESELIGTNQKFRYSIFLHPVQENSLFFVPQNYEEGKIAEKAYALMRGITEKMVKNIDKMEPEKDLGVDFFYKAELSAIKLNDQNLYNFIRRWVRSSGQRHAVVDLYGIVKEFLKYPDAMTKYFRKSEIPRDHHEMEVPGYGDRILYIDKFPDSTKFVGKMFKANFKRNNAPSKFMIDSLKKRARQMQDGVEKQGLMENKFDSWQKWFESMVDEDFEKYRKLSKSKYGVPFLLSDRHLTGHRKDTYKPYDRDFGKPFSVVYEMPCEPYENDMC